MPLCLCEKKIPMILQLRVKPRSRRSELEIDASGVSGTAWLKSPPVDGKANAELIALLAERFDCPRSAIAIKSGAGARIKLVGLRTCSQSPISHEGHPVMDASFGRKRAPIKQAH